MAKKILIADDEAHIRLLLEQTLEDFEDLGVELLIAENGEEALEAIRNEKPDLVFLDIMMPKMNGFDVCQKVRQHDELKDIHIVFLTAKGQEQDRCRGKTAGANRYMTKPFDPDTLADYAAKILQIEL